MGYRPLNPIHSFSTRDRAFRGRLLLTMTVRFEQCRVDWCTKPADQGLETDGLGYVAIGYSAHAGTHGYTG